MIVFLGCCESNQLLGAPAGGAGLELGAMGGAVGDRGVLTETALTDETCKRCLDRNIKCFRNHFFRLKKKKKVGA